MSDRNPYQFVNMILLTVSIIYFFSLFFSQW